MVKEFLAAGIWPLSAGWAPRGFERKRFAEMEYDLISLVFGLWRPEGSSDEVFVDELEREASEILGPWNRKEYLSLVEICKKNLQLNRCLAELGVEYSLRPLPAGAVPRMMPPGNVGSKVVSRKSKGKAKEEVVGTSGDG